MRTATHASFGTPSDVLTVTEKPLPTPGAGEIRVKMVMSSIHNHDLLTVQGVYGYKPELPAVAGSEAVGLVDALGEGVTHLAVGQRIAMSGIRGAWAEYFVGPAASAIPLPEAISDEAGSQLVSMPLSALVLLEFAGLKQGDWAIQNAATGAVAKVLAMIAKARGIHVINLVRRADAVSELNSLGIDNVISTADADWKDKVRALAGGAPIKAAVDGVGGPEANDLLSLLGENGLFVSFGLMSGKPLELSAGDLIFKQVTVKGFWLAKIMQTTPRETIGRWFGELLGLVASGAVTLQDGGIYDLADVKDAVAAAAKPGRPGKILIRA